MSSKIAAILLFCISFNHCFAHTSTEKLLPQSPFFSMGKLSSITNTCWSAIKENKQKTVLAGGLVLGCGVGARYAYQNKTLIKSTAGLLTSEDYGNLAAILATSIGGGLLTRKEGETLAQTAIYTLGLMTTQVGGILLAQSQVLSKISQAVSTSIPFVTPLTDQEMDTVEKSLKLSPSNPQNRLLSLRLTPEKTPEEIAPLKKEAEKLKDLINPKTLSSYDSLVVKISDNKKKLLEIENQLEEIFSKKIIMQTKLDFSKKQTDKKICNKIKKEIQELEAKEKDLEQTQQQLKNKLDKAQPNSLPQQLDILLENNQKLKEFHTAYTTYQSAVEESKTLPPLLILEGPPGSGKTVAIQAYAKKYATNGVFYSFAAQKKNNPNIYTILREKLLAESENNPNRHIIIFIDEIDNIAIDRLFVGPGDQQGESSAFLAEFLQILEKGQKNIHIIAATNCYHQLDGALRDRSFKFGLHHTEGQIIAFKQTRHEYKTYIINALTEQAKFLYKTNAIPKEIEKAIEECAKTISHLPNMSWRACTDGFCKTISKQPILLPEEFIKKVNELKNRFVKDFATHETKAAESKLEYLEKRLEKNEKEVNQLIAKSS